MSEKWYIVRTQVNREKSVAEKIRESSISGDLTGKVLEVLLPTKNEFYMRDNKKMKRERVLYNGYVFVRTNSLVDLKDYIKGVKGASGFLSNRAGEPESLSESEVIRMIGVQETAKVEEKEKPFIVDEEVVITAGPFNTMRGVVERVDGENIRVLVSIFGRKTPIEINMNQITKV